MHRNIAAAYNETHIGTFGNPESYHGVSKACDKGVSVTVIQKSSNIYATVV